MSILPWPNDLQEISNRIPIEKFTIIYENDCFMKKRLYLEVSGLIIDFPAPFFCRDGKSQQSLVLVDVWECRVIKPLEVWNEKKYSWYQAALYYNCLISPDDFIVQNISQFSAPNSNRYYAYVWMMKFKGFFFRYSILVLVVCSSQSQVWF